MVTTRPAVTAAVVAAVADAHRHQWAFVLAATVRVTRDLDLAEECVQEAYAKALTAWAERGIPDNPGGWLATAARRQAIDRHRRQATARRALPLLVADSRVDAVEPGPDERIRPEIESGIVDDRLRLIFTCCHPALATEAQVALTLRLLCGLTTAEVARAFLVSESTMAARITRAKKKIATARIPYRVPPATELPARIEAVLTVTHLLFTTGHTAPAGEDLVRRDLVERSLDLTRMLHVLLPDDPGVAGLLALILLTDARSATRVSSDGRLLLLAEQDRTRWDSDAIREGLALVGQALRHGSPSRFGLMAAIAAVHAEAPSWQNTDWRELVALYDLLIQLWPSPVVALNRAAAIGLADGPAAGLDALDTLADEPQLAGYPYTAAARADFLRQLGRTTEARASYEEALMFTDNTVERDFLTTRLQQLDPT
jgi:RNA polymerase sigma factor (sigma-70 family)